MNTPTPSYHIAVQGGAALREVGTGLERLGYQVSYLRPTNPGAMPPDVAALFVQLPARGDLSSVMRSVRAHAGTVPVIALSTARDAARAVTAVRECGAFWCAALPLDDEMLALLAARACVHYELQSENSALRSLSSAGADAPLGSSKALQELLTLADKVAPLDSTILITGESGTGKTMLARYIHRKSERRNAPFVSLNCASIPRDLLEGELFGHERGAFTGAVAARCGSIEAADTGTLFLDEIGDLPLELQPKLLTFLQDRVIQRLGSAHTKVLDVRIIAATNRALTELVRLKQFREDFFYRINVLQLHMPALRERAEDIALIVSARLTLLKQKLHLSNLSLTPEALQRLLSYNWPGNIRELENVLERAAVFCKEGLIDASDLMLMPTGERGEATPAVTDFNLARHESALIRQALAHVQGNKAKAAELLGISVKSIYNKLAKSEAT